MFCAISWSRKRCWTGTRGSISTARSALKASLSKNLFSTSRRARAMIAAAAVAIDLSLAAPRLMADVGRAAAPASGARAVAADDGGRAAIAAYGKFEAQR